MFEIVLLSGKGGTGKTSLSAAFAHLASDHVICDLDVDAPDLHLIVKPDRGHTEQFHSGHKARINIEKCEDCGDCITRCRFNAISSNDGPPRIDPLKCEGCKVCVHFCPADAIGFMENHCGDWYISNTRFGTMIHAQLFPGEENSGRLVALLRQQARAQAQDKGLNLILSDGPPGVGCPAISSLSGANLAVIVTEPTVSGRHDLLRVLELCNHFKVPTVAIINKCDIHPKQTSEVESLCKERGTPVLATLPHDTAFTHAMVATQSITEYKNEGLTEQIRQAWKKIERIMDAKQ